MMSMRVPDMRILCVTNLFPNRFQPNRGIYNWNHFTALQQHAAVRVIAPVSWTDELSARRHGCRRLVTEDWQAWNGVEVVYPRYFYTPWVLRGAYGAFLKTSIARAFRAAVADFRPDIIYGTWAYPDGWAAWQLAREARLPVVVKVHGSDLLLLDEYPGRKRRTMAMLQGADAISAVSQDLADRAAALGTVPQKAHAILQGTDTTLFFPGDCRAARAEIGVPAERRRILFVGNLVPGKGVKFLVEACQRLARDGIDFEVDIVGEGPLHATLTRQIGKLGLTERVHLRGRKLQAQLPPWYRAADVVVLPSFSEGIPNVLVEAAACGTPFVATNVGGIPEIAHLSPLAPVAPGDCAALTAALRLLMADCDAARRAVNTVGVHSVQQGVARTVCLFQQVIDAHRAAPPDDGRAVEPALAQRQL